MKTVGCGPKAVAVVDDDWLVGRIGRVPVISSDSMCDSVGQFLRARRDAEGSTGTMGGLVESNGSADGRQVPGSDRAGLERVLRSCTGQTRSWVIC
jgi:hypothetical protein